MTDKKNEEILEELFENVKKLFSKLVDENQDDQEEEDEEDEDEEDAKNTLESARLAIKMKRQITPLLSNNHTINVFALMRLAASYALLLGLSKKDYIELSEEMFDCEMSQCKKNKSKMDKIKEILKGDG